MAPTASVQLAVEDGIATIQIRRPEVMNALNGEALDGIEASLAAATSDPSVSAVVIRGDQKSFSTGIDLAYLDDILRDNRRYFSFVERFNEVLLTIENAPLPTIAVVEGYALAGGLELLLACDFALAGDHAVFGDQHANFGLVPGGGATQRLPRRIGEQRAKELLFTGRRVDAAEAVGIGLVLSSSPPHALDAGVDALTAQLRSKSRAGIAYTKRAVARGRGLPLTEALPHEAHAVAEFFTSSSSPSIGLAAFHAKSAPQFEE